MENTITHSPDQVILGYMNSTFTREYQSTLTTSLAILYDLEYPDIQEKLVSMINGLEAEDPEGLSITFIDAITNAIDSVFSQFGIELKEEASLDVKNAILAALSIVVAVEDPVPYLRVLETDLSNAEKLSQIVSKFTIATEIEILDVIVDASDNTMTRLYNELTKLEQRMMSDPDEVVNPRQLERFKAFCAYAGKEHIGYLMLESNLKMGLEASVYYSYVKNYLTFDDHEGTAKDLLSYYLLAADTWEAPIEAYRKESEQLITNPKNLLPIETAMRKIMEGFEQYLRTLDESH